MQLARAYLDIRRLQENDHTDELLNWRRTEAHDELLQALDAVGVQVDREHGARIAGQIPELVGLARSFVAADRERWRSMITPPFCSRGPAHWRLCDLAHAAWRNFVAGLQDAGIEVLDRRKLAGELTANS